MYLNEYEPMEGIFSKLKKKLKRIRPAVVLNPAMALQSRASSRKIAAVLAPVGRAIPRRTNRAGFLRVVEPPTEFRPRRKMLPSIAGPIPLPAPAASIPAQDEDGSEITIEERAAYIEDAEPRAEPYSSGYAPDGEYDEQTFEPDVPEMIAPSDLKPQPQKKSAALPIAGIVGLLALFS